MSESIVKSSIDSVVLPTTEEFDEVIDSLTRLCDEAPDTQIRAIDPYSIYLKLERYCLDLDTPAAFPGIFCLSAILKTFQGGRSLVLRNRYLPLNRRTINSSVNHDYVLRQSGSELITFAHSVRGAPKIRQPMTDRFLSDEELDSLQAGQRVLMTGFGENQEITSGDMTELQRSIQEYYLT